MTIKTPKEIKRGLECCRPVWTGEHWKTCDTTCPYLDTEEEPCKTALHNDALALIRQLEEERDAAVAALRNGDVCEACKHNATGMDVEPCSSCSIINSRFEWRGVQKED